MDTQERLQQELSNWLSTATLPVTPKELHLSTFEDDLGQEGWEILLTLPRPEGSTWDADALYRTRREIAHHMDEITTEPEESLPGTTLVKITTDDARPEDIAEPDKPEPGIDAIGPEDQS